MLIQQNGIITRSLVIFLIRTSHTLIMEACQIVLPRSQSFPPPAFVSQAWRKTFCFQVCEIKAGVGRTGNEAKIVLLIKICFPKSAHQI